MTGYDIHTNVVSLDGSRHYHLGTHVGEVQDAELWALKEALRLAIAEYGEGEALAEVRVFSDCKLTQGILWMYLYSKGHTILVAKRIHLLAIFILAHVNFVLHFRLVVVAAATSRHADLSGTYALWC